MKSIDGKTRKVWELLHTSKYMVDFFQRGQTETWVEWSRGIDVYRVIVPAVV